MSRNGRKINMKIEPIKKFIEEHKLEIKYDNNFSNLVILEDTRCVFDLPEREETYQTENYTLTIQPEDNNEDYFCVDFRNESDTDIIVCYLKLEDCLALEKLIKREMKGLN